MAPAAAVCVASLPADTCRFFRRPVERFDLRGYDFVISSSHCVAKSVIPATHARHLCYCHSPMRYAWDQFDAYFGVDRVGYAASRWLYRPTMTRLARWDAATASRVHRFVANSRHVAGRIARYYNRTASVVYPPVDTTFYCPAAVSSESHFLIVSALVPYKRIDLAIEGCRRAGARLRIVGDGPERHRLERLADLTSPFLAHSPDEAVRDEYRRAMALLLPGEEDFGIAPVESQACGRPVVAFARGGALETVVDGETGVLFNELTTSVSSERPGPDVACAVDTARLRAHADLFARERQVRQMQDTIAETCGRASGDAMVRRHNRLLVVFYVVGDALLAAWAFVLAYVIRAFDFGLIAIRKGIPPFEEYLKVLPVLALLTPVVFHFQGVYRLRRGRSRIDDFFSVLVGSILVVVPGRARHPVLSGLLGIRGRSGERRVSGARRSSGRCSWC
jgi:glycosyltransferase involved in cell wall biosynthesis